jgi:hypothetical protein
MVYNGKKFLRLLDKIFMGRVSDFGGMTKKVLITILEGGNSYEWI